MTQNQEARILPTEPAEHPSFSVAAVVLSQISKEDRGRSLQTPARKTIPSKPAGVLDHTQPPCHLRPAELREAGSLLRSAS